MVHVERQQDVFQRRHRLPGADHVGAEPLEPDLAHLDFEPQMVDEVGAVVPDARAGMGRADEVVVVVPHVDEPVGHALRGDRGQGGCLVGPLRKLPVEPVDGELVVLADALHVGVGEVDVAVVVDGGQGRGIVHDALAAVGARQVVVREAERVPHLVRRQLPHARERHLHRVGVARDLGQVLEIRGAGEHARLVVRAAAGNGHVEVAAAVVGGDPARERRHHPLPVHVVLPQPQAPQVHHPAHDLAGARIDDRVAVRVAARPPVGPVDHVVADVLRVDPLGQHFHPEGVDEARRLVGVVPPGSPRR